MKKFTMMKKLFESARLQKSAIYVWVFVKFSVLAKWTIDILLW